MKRIIYTFLLGMVCMATANGQPYNLTLNLPETGSQLHQAFNSITLAAGYSYTPAGGTMLSEIIGQSISGSVTYSPAIVPGTYAINTGLAVGKTPGNLMVGGSAGYSIPIEVPAGINGMQPSVSLNYSSNFADGLLGIGWNLRGLSSISRVNTTIYNDGKSDDIRGNMSDKYALDGKRLVTLSGSTYGVDGSIYGTEHEEFSKIVSYGATGQGPQWFKGYSKSGLIYEYGNTSDSKLMGDGSCILSWKLNRITDRYNNYISFGYVTSDDERPIGIIQYTGNGSQTPFAQVIFNYKNRADVSSYVYAGKEFTRDILLDNIEVKNNGSMFKKYALDYMRDTYAQLQKVTQYSSKNVALNPTVFAWTRQTEQFTQTHNYNHGSDELFYMGDFNGDGRQDMVTVPKKASYTTSDKWYLYLSDASGNFVYSGQGDLNTTFETFLVGDFNGDGWADLMMQQNGATGQYPNRKYYYFYQSIETSFYRNTSYFVFNDNNTTHVIDYNGDGILEFLYYVAPGSWYLCSYSGNPIYNSTIPDFGKYFIDDKAMQTRILDFNGDGCSDLLTLFSTGYKVYQFKGTNNALIETHSGTDMKNSDILLFGDYNGDGSIDIIKRAGVASGSACYLMTLKNVLFESKTLGFFNSFDITPTNNRMFAQDMNGDGRTDVVLVGKGTSTGNSYNRINVALSSGSDFITTEYTSSTTMQNGEDRFFNFGDFKGDGRTQVFYKYGSTPNSDLFSFASGTPSHLVSTVIDGLGTKFSLNYLPMSNSGVYTRSYGSHYPVSDFSSSKQLVSQVSSDDGIGGTTSHSYKYEGAKIHRQGKGFMGFAKQTTTDVTAGIITETLSGYNTTYYYPQINTVTKKTTGGATIETNSNTWTQSVLDAATKRIFPYVSATTQTNALTGHSVTVTTSSVDSYGNPGQVVKSYSNGVTETTVNNYSGFINTTEWLVGRLGSSTVTYAKSGETSVSQAVRYTYFTDGIVKPDFVYYNEGTALEYAKNHDYDRYGNLVQVYMNGTSIGESHTNYTYDSKGLMPLTLTDPLSHVTTISYDSYGRLYTQKDYLNNTITFGYDTSDRPYTDSSTIGSQTTTTYVWTGSNKPALGVYGVTKTGNDGSVATVWYDKLSRPIRYEKKGFGGQMILTDTEYNAKGQIYHVSDPYFAGGSVVWAVSYSTYDLYGRVTAIDRNTGRNTTYGYATNRVTETTDGKTTWKETDSQGLVTTAHDNGGDIVYSHFPDGKVKTVTAPGGVVTSMQYNDAARNQTQLADPSAGTINYTYNALGKIKTQTDARGRLTTYTYLPDGRGDNLVTPEGTTTYSFNTNKQLSSISSPGSISRTYGYDTKGRVTNISETIAGSAFSTSFTYDSFGRLSTRTHPSAIVETMNYNSIGYMASISAGGSTRFTITAMNAREQLTGSTYGSNLTATYGFDTYGYPSSTTTGTVQDYRYVFDPATGNLTSRQNYLRSKSESFTYDNLDRLLTATGPQNLTMTYTANGNLDTKSDIGTTSFGYGTGAGPYALTGVTSSTNIIPAVPQTISYNSFGKVSSISEANGSQTNQAYFVYNSDNQRAKMTVGIYYGAEILTRYYVGGSYMKEVQPYTSNEYTYLGGDAYTAPVVVHNNRGVISYYYLLRDNLGNITHQVNTSNTLVAEYSFDAWGRRRNATNWTYTLDANDKALFADRGFTGHEYLSWFKLYNMNGRLYDPAVGRFLNADPNVQRPDMTQNMNRYSYCLNNPLKYTDPTGKFFRELLGFFGVISSPFTLIGNLIEGNSLKTSIRNTGNEIKDLWDTGQDMDDQLFGGSKSKSSITGNSNKFYSTPYVEMEGDVLIPNFPVNFEPQTDGQCFTTGMEYISDFYNGKATIGNYNAWYIRNYNDFSILTNGMPSVERGQATMSNFFSINKITKDGIEKAILYGHPIMTNIYTGVQMDYTLKTYENYHNVVIIGYNTSDGTYIIVNPETGKYERIKQSDIDSANPFNYLFEATGTK